MKGKGLNVLLIIIIILLLVIIVGAGILYFKGESIATNGKNTTDNSTIKEMTADEKYEVFSRNMILNLKKFKGKTESPDGQVADAEICIGLDTTFDKNIISAYVDYNGDAYMIFKDKTVFSQYNDNGKYKFKSGVISIYSIEVGNGGYTGLYTINTDGTVSFISSPELNEGKIKVENKSLKNIVSIQTVAEPSGCSAIAIDIEGNIYDI